MARRGVFPVGAWFQHVALKVFLGVRGFRGGMLVGLFNDAVSAQHCTAILLQVPLKNGDEGLKLG